MLEDGEESSRQHFHLPAIMKVERDSNKKQQRRRRREHGGKRKRGRTMEDGDTALVDGFEIDLSDPRFSALYESHLYAPDPANPLYK